MANTIQHKRGTAADWSAVNPILAAGELGLETDTLKIKFGNGVTNWNNLSYAGSTADLSNYYTKAEVDSLIAELGSDFTPVEPLEFATVTPIGGYQGWELSSNDVFTPTNNLPGVASDQIFVNNTIRSFDDLFTDGHYIDIPFDLKNIKDLAQQAQTDKHIMAMLHISGFEATTRFAFVLCNKSDGIVTPIAYTYTEAQRVIGYLSKNPNSPDGTTNAVVFSNSIPYTSVNNYSGSYAPGYSLYVNYNLTSDGFDIIFDNMSSSGDYVTTWNITDASFNLQLESVNMVRVLTYKIPGSGKTVSFNFIPSTSYVQTSDGRTDWEITDQGEPTKELRCKYDDSTITLNNNNELQVNIPQVESSLTNFADVDFSNVTDTANIKMAHNAMPSNTYDNLILGASGTSYTAPADGYVVVYKFSTAKEQYFNLQTGGNTDATVKIQDSKMSPATSTLLTCTIPVTKGEKFYTVYTAAGQLMFFRFYYATGSESEAQ